MTIQSTVLWLGVSVRKIKLPEKQAKKTRFREAG